MSWLSGIPHTKDSSRTQWKLQVSRNGKYHRTYIVIPERAPYRDRFRVGMNLTVTLDRDKLSLRIRPTADGPVQVVSYVGRIRFNVRPQLEKLNLDLPTGTYPLSEPVLQGKELVLDLSGLSDLLAARQQLAAGLDLEEIPLPPTPTASGWKLLVAPNGKHERAMFVIPAYAKHRDWFEGIRDVVVTAHLERKWVAIRPAKPTETQVITLSKHGTSLKLTIPSSLRRKGLTDGFGHGTHELVDPILVGDILVAMLQPATKP